jgi:DNA-binding NarL/FixJ family response regulator
MQVPHLVANVMMTTEQSESPAIVVSLLFKVPIIRAGVAATLRANPGLLVLGTQGQGVHDLVHLLTGGIHVLVADYDNALSAARLLRSKAVPRATPPTRILLLSHRDGEADVRRALESGIQGYLPLDCQPEEMTEGVVSLYRGRRCLGRAAAQRVAESFDYEALTEREIEVLRYVVAGDANKIVAKKLNIALGTVKVHVRSIMSKLGARTRTEAAAVAQRRGLFWSGADIEQGAGELGAAGVDDLHGHAGPRITMGNPGLIQ